MAGTAARLAGGGGGNGNLNLEGFTGTQTGLSGMVEKMKYSQAQNAAGQGGVAGAGDPMSNGSTAGVAPAPITGAPVDAGGADQFAGKKFEISPVQMKGSFSEKGKGDAEGVFGNEKDRNNSLKR
jgi:hypothetical protein